MSCLQPVQKRLVNSVTIEVELAGDNDTWTPLIDARTGHPLVGPMHFAVIRPEHMRH